MARLVCIPTPLVPRHSGRALYVMSRSAKIWMTFAATAIVTPSVLWGCRWLFLAPCSSGYPYFLMVAVFPFVALLGALEVVAPGLALFLAVMQYPAYGFILGWSWVRGKVLPALLVPVIHIIV